MVSAMRNLARKLAVPAVAGLVLSGSGGIALAVSNLAASPAAAHSCAWQARIVQTGRPVLSVQVTFNAHGLASALYASNRVALKFGTYADVTALGCGKMAAVHRLPWRTLCNEADRKVVIDRWLRFGSHRVFTAAWAYCIPL